MICNVKYIIYIYDLYINCLKKFGENIVQSNPSQSVCENDLMYKHIYA